MAKKQFNGLVDRANESEQKERVSSISQLLEPQSQLKIKTSSNSSKEVTNHSQSSDEEGKDGNGKIIRQGFTMPEEDYNLLVTSMKRAVISLQTNITKSEIVRAGLLCLSKLTDAEFENTMLQIEQLKRGRPWSK